MEFIFFDQHDNQLFRRSDAIKALHIVEEYKHTAKFPYNPKKVIEAGMRIGWIDEFREFQLFEIRQPSNDPIERTQEYEAEHVAIAELSDCIIRDKRNYGTSAAAAVMNVLEDTPWEMGVLDASVNGHANFYHIDVWKALVTIREKWGIALIPRLTYNENVITGRFIDVHERQGKWRGVRLSINRNISQAGIKYDDRAVKTALIGLGKGEQVGETAAGDSTYGRKIKFTDIAWIEPDNPANKPSGQDFVEDQRATAALGRNFRPRFGVVDFPNCEDQGELLELTWDALQTLKKPKVTISLTVADLKALGYSNEGMMLGDDVVVVIDPFDFKTQARVVKLQKDLIHPENTKPVIGDYRGDVNYKNAQSSISSGLAKQIADNVPSLLQGYIDTAKTIIMSSQTIRRTMPDGSELYVSEDEKHAIWFSAAGILLADSKDAAGNWNWRTAITGAGATASEITSGILNAALVKILGTDGTFWDNNYIQITDPNNPMKIMRYGLYNGVDSGLAFSDDGGNTWRTAVGFDGVHVGDTMSGFDLSALGFTNGDNIQLMSNGYIQVGGIRMEAGSSPYMSFDYGGVQAFKVSNGVFNINQAFNVAGGAIYFPGLPTTNEQPNLFYNRANGRLYESLWISPPPGTGGGTEPPPSQGTISFSVSWNASSAAQGERITASISGGNEATSFTYNLYISGNLQTSYTTTSRSYSYLPFLTGNYVVKVEATGPDGAYGSATSGTCSVGTSGGSGGTGDTARTNRSGVYIKSGTSELSDNVAFLSESGTQVTITGVMVRAGNYDWWPVSWYSSSGYIRSDYLTF